MSSTATRSATSVAWIFALLLAGCGSAHSAEPVDAGIDALAQLSLTVSVSRPVLEDLVLSSGEIELERLGLVGDTTYDDRTQIPHETFTVGGASQQFAFATAGAGIYSRLRTEIDHVELFGTWRGTPLHVQTQSDERVVDIRGPAQELSPTASAPFTLAIDGTQWLTASILDAAPSCMGSIEIDEHTSAALVGQIMDGVTGSFTLTAP